MIKRPIYKNGVRKASIEKQVFSHFEKTLDRAGVFFDDVQVPGTWIGEIL